MFQYLHENLYKLKTKSISYKYLKDEIPGEKFFKYAQQCQNRIYEKNVSSSNGTLIRYVDLPLLFMFTLKYGESPSK